MKKSLLPILVTLLLAAALWLLLGDDPGLGPGGLPDDPLAGVGGAPAEEALTTDPVGVPAPGDGAPGATPRPVEGPPDPMRGRLAVQGHVVDGRRKPVSGVEVEFRVAGWLPIKATTDAAGHYALTVTRGGRRLPSEALLVARAGDQRVGAESVWIPPGPLSLLTAPPIVLEPVADLTIAVRRGEKALEGAVVVVARRLGAAVSILATTRTQVGGTCRVRGLPHGPLDVFASAPGEGRGHAQTTLPREDAAALTVVLQGERTFSVFVVDGSTSSPVRGAEVLVGDALSMPEPQGPGYLPPPALPGTDARGRVTVRAGLGETIFVSARAPGYPLAPWWGDSARSVKPDQDEVRIALYRERSVRFPVLAGGVDPPLDGETLRVELTQAAGALGWGRATAAMESGALVVRGLPRTRVRGVAIARSGDQAEFVAEADVMDGSSVVFRGARGVTVRVTEPGGAPVPDLMLRLITRTPAAAIAPAPTDADGRVTFMGVGADRVTVHTVPPDRPRAGAQLATLDLTENREEYEVVLRALLVALVQVQIDGEARLPSRYQLLADGGPVSTADIEEDPDAGLLRVQLRPGDRAGTLTVALHAEGYLPASAQIPLPARGSEETVSLDLQPAGALVARVQPPDDGLYTLSLQRLDPESGEWKSAPRLTAPGRPSPTPATAESTQRFDGLEAGRYRVLDARSRATSEAVEVKLGGPPAEVRIDLSGAAAVEGRVVAPPGTDFTQVRVRVVGRDDPTRSWAGVQPGADGTFTLRGVHGQRITVDVVHPTLRSTGPVTIDPGGRRPELRLEAGPQATFRVTGLETARGPGPRLFTAPVSVYLYRGAASGEPAQVLHPLGEGGSFTFGGFQPGTYTLWFSFRAGFAPLTMTKVELGEGFTDLGTLRPTEGTTLRLRLQKTDDAEAPPAVWATVERVGSPSYMRTAAREPDTGELVCRGLGEGTFLVTVRAARRGSMMGPHVLLEKRVTVSGSGETVLDVPPR